jgi:hypothetical protein
MDDGAFRDLLEETRRAIEGLIVTYLDERSPILSTPEQRARYAHEFMTRTKAQNWEFKATVANLCARVAGECERRGIPTDRFSGLMEEPYNAGGLAGLRFQVERIEDGLDDPEASITPS